MTFKRLCLKLCKVECGSREIDIAQMREAMSKLRKLIKKDPAIIVTLLKGKA